MYPAKYYRKVPDNHVICHLCPHMCRIEDQCTGRCNVRKNSQGNLHSVNFGYITGIAVDPIEKKPLYHFFPGKGILSIGSVGCNMSCSFCQNAHISQKSVESSYALKQYSSTEIIDMAHAMDQKMIAYTYNEPVVFYEYMLECAALAKSKGMKNVMVSNGYINKKPLQELIEYIDAFNIDLKAFDDDFYKDVAGARLEPVLDTIQIIASAQKHLELTFLVIPGLNDDPAKFKEMINWILDVCGDEQVLHLSRYFPHHQLHRSRTPLSTIEEFTELARSKLKYIYPGNTGNIIDSSTYCHCCKKLLVERSMYNVHIKMEAGRCTKCGTQIPGIYN